MDPRLVRHYNLELQHLREMGAEFAEQFPRVAGRLGMHGLEVSDPYVERLLEGVGFLAARVQLKLEAEFPRFTQALLEMIYPHYLAPMPSMLVAQLVPDLRDPNLMSGPIVPRGSGMTGSAGDTRSCEFRTAHDVRLWPIEVSAASYVSYAPDLPLASLPVASRIKGALRVRLKAAPGLTFSQLPIHELVFFLAGREDVANRLYELCLGHALGVLVLPRKPANADAAPVLLPAAALQPVGFVDDEALLPVTARSFQGYRVLQEYFACPERFRSFRLTKLGRACAAADCEEIEIVILLDAAAPTFEGIVDRSNVALFTTPAINLFPKRADRVHVADDSCEYHVVADRTRPLDFEIYELTSVVGHGAGADEQEFRPFYAASSADVARTQAAYFTARREPRLIGESEGRRGSRSSYVGTEVFVSLVDPEQAPFRSDLRQLSIRTLCTNRDLPLQIAVGAGATDLSLEAAAPIHGVRIVAGPSRPYGPLADGAIAWRAINHLSLNYLSLIDASAEEGAVALRRLLQLYAPDTNASARRQIAGITSVEIGRVVRRLPGPGPLTFGRGVRIAVSVDDLAFEGGSAFLLGAVLNEFLARHVSVNTFTETVLRSVSRGEINRWMPRWGTRPTL